jgi:hypothetical protein
MKKILNYLDDIFYWLGAALVSIGAYCIHPVFAFFSAGAFCLLFGFLIGKARANNP